MSSAAPGKQRGVSRSSMRTSHRPPCWRASRKLPTAVTRDPKWRGPVGEGAKRPRYLEGDGMGWQDGFRCVKPILRGLANRRIRYRILDIWVQQNCCTQLCKYSES